MRIPCQWIVKNFKGWLKEDYGEVKRIKKFKWAKGRWIRLVKVL